MALNVVGLQTEIERIFDDMNDMQTGGNKYMADELANAIYEFINAGVVKSDDDAGTIGSNTYAGKGTGKMTIDEDLLAEKFLAVFEDTEVSDASIASGMTDVIDEVCSKKDIVQTETVGTQTTPVGASSLASGIGLGTFSGSKAAMSSALVPAFVAMIPLTSGGNAVFAAALATSIYTYLTTGSVSITLQAPIVGSATGKIE